MKLKYYSLQWHNKIFLLVLILLLSTYFSSAFELGVSPPQLDYTGEINEVLCKKVQISSEDYQGMIILTDKWAKEGIYERDLNVYNIEGKDINLSIVYPIKVYLDKKESVNVCLRAEKEGNYHGAILFQADESAAGVGTWINLTVIEGEDNFSIKNLGFERMNISSVNPVYVVIGGIVIADIFLVGFLVYLLILARKKGIF